MSTNSESEYPPTTCRLCGRVLPTGYPHSRCLEGKCRVIPENHPIAIKLAQQGQAHEA